jgi:peroxidase
LWESNPNPGAQKKFNLSVSAGAHTIGRSHCRFFEGRFNDFRGTGKCDPSMGTSFTDDLRSMCNRSATVPMDNDSDQVFDPHYYKNIVAGNGVLHVDQALNAFENTSSVVHAYAADNFTFYRDFSRAMVKLTSLGVLTGQEGQIRKNCSKVVRGGYYTEPEIVP